jgi:phage portal protein BeeE
MPPQSKLDYHRLAGRLDHNSVVAICLAWMRRQVAQGVLEVGYETEEGEYEPIQGHPLTRIQRRPNPYYSWGQVIGLVSDGLSVDGNAYVYKARAFQGRGDPVEWYVLPNHRVQVIANSDRVIGYRYTDDNGQQDDYKPSDIIHFRDGIDPLNPVIGYSALKAQVRNVAGINAGEIYTSAILRNGHAGKLMVPKEGSLMLQSETTPFDETERNAEKRRLKYNLAGEHAGSVEVGLYAMDVHDLGLTPEDMALDRVLNWPVDLVVASFGLNSLVLGLPSSADTRTYSNYAEARKDAWESAVVPRQDAIAYGFQSQGLFAFDEQGNQAPEYGDSPDVQVWWDRSEVAALHEDSDARAQRASTLFTGTLLPRNRVLQETGYDPIEGADGDRYYGEPTEFQEEKQEEQQQQFMENGVHMPPGEEMGQQPTETPAPEDKPTGEPVEPQDEEEEPDDE